MIWRKKLRRIWERLGMKCKKYKLGEICDLKIGRTPPRKEHEWFSKNQNGYKWISIKDMGNVNKYISDSSEYLTEGAVNRFNIPIVNPNTILLSFKLTVGKTAISTIKMTTNEAIAQLPIKNDKLVDNEYLYYYLSNYQYDSLGSTSSIATAVNSTILKDIEVELPSIIIQKQISKVLREIDDKIELNNKINKNLEEQISLIYNNYINKYSYQIVKIKDIINKANTGADAIQKAPIVEYDTGVRCIRVGDFTNHRSYYQWGYTKISNKDYELYKIQKNDILVTRTATLGLNVIIWNDINAVYNNGIIRLKIDKSKLNPLLLYRQLQTKDFYNYISKIESETSVRPNMKINYLLNYNIPYFDYNQQNALVKTIMPLQNSIFINTSNNYTLLKLRDILLPKLMSGEIDVSKIDI